MMGMICYVEGHVDRAEFARQVEQLTGRTVPVELVRYWYGRCVPLRLGKSWDGRGHTFSAKPGQGAKRFTVIDIGEGMVRTREKRVESGSKIGATCEEVQIDLLYENSENRAF